MAVPTKPYSTSDQVGYLVQSKFYGGAPSPTTVPSSTVIATLITWTDGVIEMEFQSRGYKLPWVEISGETWPVAQTTLLGFMSAIGAAAMAGGHILKPAPMMGPGQRGSQGNIYSIAFEQMRKQIETTGYRFRAQYYAGSKAEQWIAEPYGPRGDFMEDYWDPTDYWLLKQYTEELHTVFAEMNAMDIDWDFMFSLRATGAN